MDVSIFNDLDRDALKETANVGAGNASIALSEVIKKTVTLKVSDVNFLTVDQASSIVSGPQNLVVGVYTPVSGGMTGNIVMILDKQDALDLSAEIQALKSRRDDVLSDSDQKNLKVVGGLVSEYYIKSLNEFLNLSVAYGATNIVVTFGESIFDIIVASLSPDINDLLLINTDFSVDSSKIAGKFILLLGLKDVGSLLNVLRAKVQ